jgi:L-lactate dehydrogenase complex protein LldG
MSGINSRQLILDRIRVALDVRSDDPRENRKLREWQAIPREYRSRATLQEPDRIALFEERIRHYNANTYYSDGSVAAEIAYILSNRGKRILIVPAAFPSRWLPDGFMFIPDDNLTYEQLNSNDGVVTTCTLAIAVTGTIVLESSPEQGRRATTLIPDYHLCVLRRQDIVEVVPEAFLKLEGIKDHPLTFISGPSATVDIEMTRVRGVHGPRTLDVLVV